MKKFSKEELQEQADKFMKAENVKTFYATEDGNFFHPKDKGLAQDHNNKNVKGEVIVFTAEPEVVEPTKEDKVKAIKDAIVDMANLKITDLKEIKGRLKHAKFDEALIEEVLSEINTHEIK